MPSDNRSRGCLVALEGETERELAAASKLALHAVKKHGALSRWDSSNTFFELGLLLRKLPSPSPRTLILLYASDLMFRLRWEIKPALEEGRVVLAVPYVHTAIGLGLAFGMPRPWLEELFSFAPKADTVFRAPDHKKPRSGKGRAAGFAEFCCGVLSAGGHPLELDTVAHDLAAYLDAAASKGECRSLTKPALKKLRPK